jgi:hypothetical protein
MKPDVQTRCLARGANKVSSTRCQQGVQPSSDDHHDEGLWGKKEGRDTGDGRDSVDDAVMCC